MTTEPVLRVFCSDNLCTLGSDTRNGKIILSIIKSNYVTDKLLSGGPLDQQIFRGDQFSYKDHLNPLLDLKVQILIWVISL